VLAGTRGIGRADRSREPVASAEIGADQVTVPAESLAQLGDLYLEVPFRHGDAGPNPVQELVFCHQRPIGLEQDQEKIEGARSQPDRRSVGEQLTPTE
jgi:hypothetical protein